MIARPLSRLMEASGLQVPSLGLDPLVRSVCLDSRRSQPGSLFLAVRGQHLDGARFAAEAVSRGAVAVVAESEPPGDAPRVPWIRVANARSAAARLAREFWGRPDANLTLVGITGTNGKTTVAHLLEAMALAGGRAAGRIGTNGHAFGGQVVPTDRTTPEAPDFYRLLSEMSRHGVDVVAVEVTSHALALSRVEGATFRTAAFLNLGRDHLDFHGTMDAYFESKLILFESLGENATAVVAADDPRGHLIRSRTRARLITFGRAANSEVRLSEEDVRADGSRARLVLPDGAVDVRTELRGRFNLLNVAAAAGCALSLGMDRDAVRDGVAALRRIPGRLEPVKCGQPFEIFVDFAHTEQALASVLQATREFTAGRIAVVFGCGGDRDPGKRPGMGRAAAEHADYAILTSDNPRQEDPLGILREVERGFVATAGARDRYVLEPDRRAAIARVVHWARPGDTVVVAGKGHEVAQTLAEGRIPFDDRSEVREALFSAGWRN